MPDIKEQRPFSATELYKVRKLFYITQCCTLHQTFCSPMLQTLRSSRVRDTTPLCVECKQGVNWFLTCLPYNSGVHLMSPSYADAVAKVDSCLAAAACVYYHQMYLPFLRNQHLNICQSQMLSMAVAVKLWAPAWSQYVGFYCIVVPL